MLISAVMPIMSIYRLPHGQYSYSGHVINLPQDVTSFASSLSRVPSELEIVVVRQSFRQRPVYGDLLKTGKRIRAKIFLRNQRRLHFR